MHHLAMAIPAVPFTIIKLITIVVKHGLYVTASSDYLLASLFSCGKLLGKVAKHDHIKAGCCNSWKSGPTGKHPDHSWNFEDWF